MNPFRVLDDSVVVERNMTFIKILDPKVKLDYEYLSYPFGRCINLGPGIRSLNKTVDIIEFDVVKNNFSVGSKIQINYKDPINDGFLNPVSFEMEGYLINVETDPKSHFKKYTTKLSISDHVFGDPKFDCIAYSEENSYTRCLEEDLIKKFHNLIGCHPPIISRMKEGLCKKTFNISKEDYTTKKIYDILYEITNDYESKLCKRPCRKYSFKPQKLYESTMHTDENRVTIVFPKRVQLTKTSFLITIPNLLTGIGGAISSGQTLMWIFVTLLGFTSAVKRFQQWINGL